MGKSVPRDRAKAIHYARLAADQGHTLAQVSVGRASNEGAGVVADPVESARYFRLAADQGIATAQHYLGIAYHNGNGVQMCHDASARLYRLAADQGNAGAQWLLALSYCDGHGVERDFGTAARYHRLAVDQNHSPSQLALGAMHFEVRLRLELAGPRAGALLLTRAAQCAEPHHDTFRRQALELLCRYSDQREVASACCTGCGKTDGLKRCIKCQTARFCGSACMRQMWPIHKRCCKEWTEQCDDAPPAPE
mmetsp:Transcript_40608/g.100370  ORF Transcript_40608/g.100370 Transcript_40608/m.100370 type:complete len:251 (+) Transcript_40608:236-988(+)